MNIKDKVKLSEYFGYFGYGFGQCISFGIVGSFSLFFFTDIVGLTAISASLIFLIARIWDAVNDPLLASFIDKSHKAGRQKFIPVLRYIPILMAIVTVMLFVSFPQASYAVKFIYCFLLYIAWGMVYTVSDVSFWSASTLISSEAQERTTLITVANIGVFGGIGFAGFLAPIVVKYFNETGYTENISVILTVVFAMFLLLLMTLIGSRMLKERVEATSGEKITLKMIFKNLAVNKPLRIILIVYFLNLGLNIVQVLAIYFFTSNLGSAGLFATYSLITTFAALAFLILPILTKSFKKKHILLFLLTLDIVLRVIFFVIGYENPIMTTVFMGVLFTIYALTAPILSVMIAETIEYTQYHTGVRTEALTFSGQTFAGKLSVAIAGAFAGVLLTFIGYNPDASNQTAQTLLGLFVIVSILPAVFSLLRIIVLMFLKFDETEHQRMVNELNLD